MTPAPFLSFRAGVAGRGLRCLTIVAAFALRLLVAAVSRSLSPNQTIWQIHRIPAAIPHHIAPLSMAAHASDLKGIPDSTETGIGCSSDVVHEPTSLTRQNRTVSPPYIEFSSVEDSRSTLDKWEVVSRDLPLPAQLL